MICLQAEALYLAADFDHTKVNLFALASSFVPSRKRVSVSRALSFFVQCKDSAGKRFLSKREEGTAAESCKEYGAKVWKSGNISGIEGHDGTDRPVCEGNSNRLKLYQKA